MTEAKMLGAKDVAAILKVDVINFRRWLRANDQTADGGRYEWKKGSPALERLLKQYKEYQENGPQREPKSEGKKSSKKKGGKKAAVKKSAKPKATRARAEESDFEESDETEEL